MDSLFDWNDHNLDGLFDLFEEEMQRKNHTGAGISINGSGANRDITDPSATILGTSHNASSTYGTSPSKASALDLYNCFYFENIAVSTNNSSNNNNNRNQQPHHQNQHNNRQQHSNQQHPHHHQQQQNQQNHMCFSHTNDLYETATDSNDEFGLFVDWPDWIPPITSSGSSSCCASTSSTASSTSSSPSYTLQSSMPDTVSSTGSQSRTQASNGVNQHRSKASSNGQSNSAQHCGTKRTAGTSLLAPKPKLVKTASFTSATSRQIHSASANSKSAANAAKMASARQHYGQQQQQQQQNQNGSAKSAKNGQTNSRARSGVTPIRSLNFNTGGSPQGTARPLIPGSVGSKGTAALNHHKQQRANQAAFASVTINSNSSDVTGISQTLAINGGRQSAPSTLKVVAGVGLPPVVSSGRHAKSGAGSTGLNGQQQQQPSSVYGVTNVSASSGVAAPCNSNSTGSSNCANSNSNTTSMRSAAYNVNDIYRTEHDYCGRAVMI